MKNISFIVIYFKLNKKLCFTAETNIINQFRYVVFKSTLLYYIRTMLSSTTWKVILVFIIFSRYIEYCSVLWNIDL